MNIFFILHFQLLLDFKTMTIAKGCDVDPSGGHMNDLLINPLSLEVAILVPMWHGMVEDNVAQLATMLSHAALDIHHSVSLLVTPSSLEWALASQGSISLHDAAISEQIF